MIIYINYFTESVIMATIINKNGRYSVVFYYTNEFGVRKQKWKSFKLKKDAIVYKKLIETDNNSETNKKTNKNSHNKTVAEYLYEWIDVYSKSNWQFSQYMSVQLLMKNHIIPNIGKLELQKVTPLDIEKFYNKLRITKKKDGNYLSPTTIRYIHNTIKVAFRKAVEWELIQKSPVICAAPKAAGPKITIWSPYMFRSALENISHKQLHLAVHIAFICSLRPGEVLALKWDDIILDNNNNYIIINKTIQRVSKEALNLLSYKELVYIFPNPIEHTSSSLILKTPKTKSSIRKVFITPPLSAELKAFREKHFEAKEYYGSNYNENNMVFSQNNGLPVEVNLCTKWFRKWQMKSNLGFPTITFHEIRHSSSTYKLRASGGDAKSVQGDTGHAKADTLLNTYSHIQDEQRIKLTKTIAKDFYKQDYEETTQQKCNELFKTINGNPQLKNELLKRLLGIVDYN